MSMNEQDLTVQRNGLITLEVPAKRIYVDDAQTGTSRDRPGPRLALAEVRAGDTFVVTKLDHLARSLPDARDVVEGVTRREVKLSNDGDSWSAKKPSLSPSRTAGNIQPLRGRNLYGRLKHGVQWASAAP
jgi:hypothetical protein